MADTYYLHVISNTHWDREWLYDFQETRMLLVEFLDKLLDILDTEPRYHAYLMDSQTVPIEDYLEVRPENRARVEKHVRANRLYVGPWYTCPEEFNVNGESLARNLLVGHRVAESLGGVMKVGYSPFSYGQCSQMPQVYRGFGIDSILFYHGIDPAESRSEFIFEGPDGSSLFASRMGSFARYNFFFHVFRPTVYGKRIEERRYLWADGGLPFHLCGERNWQGHHFLVDPERRLDEEKLAEGLRRLKELELGQCTSRHLAYMMGMDSTEPDRLEVELIEKGQQYAGEDKLFHSSLPEWVEQAKQHAEGLVTLKGERRVPRPIGVRPHLYGDVTSSRVRIKQANARAEHALQRFAEPFSSIASALGERAPRTLLDMAWRELLRCHAHDSIAGSGVDQIERDMLNRLAQVSNIAAGLTRRAFQAIQRRIGNSDVTNDELILTVFNPSPYPRSEVVTAYLDLPPELNISRFSLRRASDGKRLAFQEAAREDRMAVVRHLGDATTEMPGTTVKIHFPAEELPPLGYATYLVRGEKEADLAPAGDLVTGERTMENEHLRVEVNSDGTLTVTHKETGRVFAGLHSFEDSGEAGHPWRHVPPAFDRVVSSRGFPVKIALAERGPYAAAFSIEYSMSVPAELVEGPNSIRRLDADGDAASRSEHEVPLTIRSFVSLRRGSRVVEVTTKLENRADSHRLRVLFPSGLAASHSSAESAFDVVDRPIDRGPDSPWSGTYNPTHPQQRFVSVSDGKVGLTVLNEGLREYEVTDDAARAVCLTLLRAYEVALTTVSWRWERHPEMRLSQCHGEHAFRYAIYPHAGDWAAARAFVEAERLNVPVEPAQAGPHPGELPKEMSFLRVEPDGLVLSALKPAERSDNLVVRVFNPTAQAIEGSLTFFRPVKAARLTNLNEEPEADIRPRGKAVPVTVGAKKIVTVEVALL